MLTKKIINIFRDNFAILFIAAIVGTIVSFVAQLFIISAKNIYEFIFYNESFKLHLTIWDINLNLIPLLVCIPSSILVGLLMYKLKLPRWFQFSIYVIGTLGIALTLLLNQNDVRPFIYFQF